MDKLDEKTIRRLIDEAIKARKNAYAPYSKYHVGASVLATSGNIYTGSNVENVSYGLSVCAERNAIFSAVNEGERAIQALAVVAEEESIARPCGACLQVINEFSPKERPVQIIAASADGNYDVMSISEYLPHAFNF